MRKPGSRSKTDGPQGQHSSLTSGLHSHVKEPPSEPSYPWIQTWNDCMLHALFEVFFITQPERDLYCLYINHSIKIPDIKSEPKIKKPLNRTLVLQLFHFESACSSWAQGQTLAVPITVISLIVLHEPTIPKTAQHHIILRLNTNDSYWGEKTGVWDIKQGMWMMEPGHWVQDIMALIFPREVWTMPVTTHRVSKIDPPKSTLANFSVGVYLQIMVEKLLYRHKNDP